ncbi:MAG: transcription termination/antitermination protein NusG [Nitrospinota bacterium]
MERTSAWYALQTRSRHEKFTLAHLKATGFEVFLPLITRLRRWKDRRVRVDFPLFPGYCFVRCDVTDFRQVRMIPGAVDLVGTAGKPMPIPENEIGAVHQLVTCTLPFDPHPRLEPGMTVRVVRGPLEGVEGTLIRKTPRARFLIAINLLSRGATVSIDAGDVVPV